ncbi:unnamed protein product [Prorocentrum cordatum]|uniref:Uncharacterized protein n=1 Tax=Prorocentrum cordatum TaxID=2364126 RepID=A0ABN9Y344_9DINO|nr:unnamed protein product [Polarella glacialis]
MADIEGVVLAAQGQVPPPPPRGAPPSRQCAASGSKAERDSTARPRQEAPYNPADPGRIWLPHDMLPFGSPIWWPADSVSPWWWFRCCVGTTSTWTARQKRRTRGCERSDYEEGPAPLADQVGPGRA